MNALNFHNLVVGESFAMAWMNLFFTDGVCSYSINKILYPRVFIFGKRGNRDNT